MSFFLDQSSRYDAALDTFDPLRGEWLMRVIDPWPDPRSRGQLHFGRITAVFAFAVLPMLVFSAWPSATSGGQLTGSPGALLTDMGTQASAFQLALLLVLLPIARRALGDLTCELTLRGVTGQVFRPLVPAPSGSPLLLRGLEYLSRLGQWRGLVWFALLVAWFQVIHLVFLGDHKQTWQTTAAQPGTILNVFAGAGEQPNLAGIWFFFAFSPVAAYVVVLAARVFVGLATLTSHVASDPDLRIVPWHPDGAGGLQPVGQVALLLSSFTFVIGVSLAGFTVQEWIYRETARTAGPLDDTNVRIQFVLWAFYLVLGTLLFFLPMAPLRRKMASAKRDYLVRADRLRQHLGMRHEQDLDALVFEADSLQGLGALNELTEKATAMAVWPFDRQTFTRYAGLLAAPLAPLVADKLPAVLDWLKAYLEVGAN